MRRQPDPTLALVTLDAQGTPLKHYGGDEPDAEDVPKGINITTSDPGGFKDAKFTLARSLNSPSRDLELLRHSVIYGRGGRIAFEGRAQDLPRQHSTEDSIAVGLVGFSSRLDDDPSFREIYVSRDLGELREFSAQHRLDWKGTISYEGFNVAPDTAEGRQSLVLDVNGHWEAQRPLAGALYDAGPGLKIAYVDYEATCFPDVNFLLEPWAADDDKPNGQVGLGDLMTAASETPFSGTLTPGKRVFGIQWYHAFAGVGVDGAQYRATVRKLAWFGNHGLPIRGAFPNRGLYGHDVIADIVKRTAPDFTYTTGPEGSIEDSNFAIPHLVFFDPGKGSDAILGVNAYHQRPWGLEEKKRFFWRNGYRKRWRLRRSKGDLVDLLGPQAEDAVNGVVGKFTDPAGISRVVGPVGLSSADATSPLLEDTNPTNPVNLAGIPRKLGELQLSFVTDIPGAIQVCYAWLQDRLREASSRGSVVARGWVEDENGVLYPPWCMRAGDSATVVDGDEIERRLIETNYDHDSIATTGNLSATPHKLEAMQERMGVVLQGVVD